MVKSVEIINSGKEIKIDFGDGIKVLTARSGS